MTEEGAHSSSGLLRNEYLIRLVYCNTARWRVEHNGSSLQKRLGSRGAKMMAWITTQDQRGRRVTQHQEKRFSTKPFYWLWCVSRKSEKCCPTLQSKGKIKVGDGSKKKNNPTFSSRVGGKYTFKNIHLMFFLYQSLPLGFSALIVLHEYLII